MPFQSSLSTRRLGVTLLVMLVAAALVTTAALAQAPDAVRVSGDTPTAFSVALSNQIFDDAGSGVQAQHAVIGRDDVFADTLAVGPFLAGGPLLYVPGGDAGTMPQAVLDELARVLPPGSVVYIAGGVAAVSADIEAAIDGAGFLPIRLAGDERTATAAAIARRAEVELGSIGTFLVAVSGDWPDAIAGAALAAGLSAGPDGAVAILLTETDTLAEAAEAVIADHPDAEVVALGGTAVISDAVATAAGVDRRLAGTTRAHTALAIAGEHGDVATGATVVQGFTDEGWVEGNAGAALLQPLLLTGPSTDEVNDPTAQALEGRSELVVLGGTDRISDAGLQAAEDAR